MTFSLMDADGGGTIDGKNTIQRCDAACYCLTALLAMHMTLLTTPSILHSAGGELGNAFQVRPLILCATDPPSGRLATAMSTHKAALSCQGVRSSA